MIQNGTDGVYIVFQDSSDGAYWHVFTQRVLDDGSTPWGDSGFRLVPGTTGEGQVNVRGALDGLGGLVAVFEDYSNSSTQGANIVAQRVHPDGSLLWGTVGAQVCAQANIQYNPVLAATGDGGLVCVWTDYRNDATYGHDLYRQKLDAYGNYQWYQHGTSLAITAGNQEVPIGVADGDGGLFVAWRDNRDYAENGYDIYAVRLLFDGTVIGTTGRAVVTAPGHQYPGDIEPDGHGGAWISWQDYRTDSYDSDDTYVQKMSSGCRADWSDNGLIAGGGDGSQYESRLARDAYGDVYVVWRDNRNGYSDIYGQLISASGSRKWSYYGVPLSRASFNQDHPVPVAVPGGCFVAWQDTRAYSTSDIFAQRIDRSGHLGDPAPAMTRAADAPNDQGGLVELGWTASYLDAYGEAGVDAYTVWRRNGDAKDETTASAAEISERLGAGIEDVRALLDAGWILSDEIEPYELAEYGCLAESFGDSTAVATPVTEYMVMAHDGAYMWSTEVVAAWSVDNLSPGTPLSLAAAMVGTDAHLNWTASGVDDADLSLYNVFRADTPLFSPGAGSFVGSSETDAFVEAGLAGGDWYYRVTAVDVHGNESPASNAAPVRSLTAAQDLPGAFVVRGAYPNPFNPSTSIRFDLPTASRTRVEVLDMRGRRVRALLDADLGGGAQAVRWDGRDDGGRLMPSGTYFVRVRAGARIESVKLMLAK